MNVSCVNFPPDVSEIDEAKFTLRKSHLLKTPTINESLVALECKLHSITRLGEDRNLTLGEVVNISTNTDVLDTEKNYVNIDNYKPIARLFGNMYAELSNFFELKRLNKDTNYNNLNELILLVNENNFIRTMNVLSISLYEYSNDLGENKLETFKLGEI